MHRAILAFLLIGLCCVSARAQTEILPGFSHTVTCQACTVSTDSSVKIVDPSGNGDYTSVWKAVSDAEPGDIIRVKNGTYNARINIGNEGTAAEPITLEAYPGHRPVIDCAGSPNKNPGVYLDARFWIIRGFEITRCLNGFRATEGDFVFENNYVHENENQGILVQTMPTTSKDIENFIIRNNRSEHNGKHCLAGGDGVNPSPKHCHALYLSAHNFCEKGIKNGEVTGNTLAYHGGTGLQMNAQNCSDDSLISSILVADNDLINNAWGMSLWKNIQNSMVRDNEFVADTFPASNFTEKYFIVTERVKNNSIINNNFKTSIKTYEEYRDFTPSPAYVTVFNGNLWRKKYKENDEYKYEYRED